MTLIAYDVRRKNRWYFGGVASAAVTFVTHPLDLIKVHLQTQQTERHSVGAIVSHIHREQGVLGFYSGLSASLVRQLTYTTARFGIYEWGKTLMPTESFAGKILVAITAGCVAGVVGVPADIVNVRMQNDIKLPVDKRRNYKHVFDGLVRMVREEGPRSLFTGVTPTIARAIFMTIGQNVSYDQVKASLLSVGSFEDNMKLHFTCSVISAGIATLVTQPFDTLKTRSMNAKPGEFKNIWHIIMFTAKGGPTAFFKGITPAFIRIGPQTVLVFVMMEQMRLYYGYLPLSPAPKQA